jgi:hypothetical protein
MCEERPRLETPETPMRPVRFSGVPANITPAWPD